MGANPLSERKAKLYDAGRILEWFGKRLQAMVLATLDIPEALQAVIVLSHGRFQPGNETNMDKVTIDETEECKARVWAAVDIIIAWIDKYGSANMSWPVLCLNGAEEQYKFMAEWANQRFAELGMLHGYTIHYLGAGSFPSTNSPLQMQAINTFMLNYPDIMNAFVLSGDYHEMRLSLSKGAFEESVRERVHFVGQEWVANENRATFEQALDTLLGETKRCVIYGMKGDIAQPWDI